MAVIEYVWMSHSNTVWLIDMATIEYIIHMDESQQVFGCYSSGNAVGQ